MFFFPSNNEEMCWFFGWISSFNYDCYCIRNSNFTCYFVWLWNLVSHIKGRPETEDGLDGNIKSERILVLLSSLFPSGFLIEMLYAFIIFLCILHAMPISTSYIWWA